MCHGRTVEGSSVLPTFFVKHGCVCSSALRRLAVRLLWIMVVVTQSLKNYLNAKIRIFLNFLVFPIAVLGLISCGDIQPAEEAYVPETARSVGNERDGSILGGGNLLDLFGNSKKNSGEGSGIGVNAYLWRATLDTVSFMPLASADPFGGVIITDWFTPPETPDERLKLNIFILGRELRADGVRVSVFRQNRKDPENWSDAPVAAKTSTNLENKILTRARQLRFAANAKTN